MIRVVRAEGLRLRRIFCSLPSAIYRGDVRYVQPAIWGGRQVLSARSNPLFRGGAHALFLAFDDGVPVARALTGDQSAAGQREGYFSLFDCLPRPDAVRALMCEVVGYQRALGNDTLVGPIPPCVCDFGKGVLVRGFGGRPDIFNTYNAPWYGECLEAAGFVKLRDHLSCRFEADGLAWEQYRRVAEWSKRRFSLTAKQAEFGRPRALCEAFHRILSSGEDVSVPFDVLARMVAQLMPYLDEQYFFIAWAGDVPVGILMGIPDGVAGLRLATMHVAPAWRRRGAAAVLMDGMLNAARRGGISYAVASLIAEDNAASRLGAERAGGKPDRVYRQYLLNL